MQQHDGEDPQLVVVGEGVSLARPDSCVIAVQVNAMRETISEALRDVAALADLAMKSLRETGFADVDLPTRNLSVRDWLDRQTQQVTARIGSYHFAIVIRDLEAVSNVVDTLTAALGDALQIQGIAFAHSDPAPLRAAARRDAVEDAKARAEQLAEAAGLRLGHIRMIHEGSFVPPGVRMAAASPQERSMPINPGNEAVSVRVTVAFALREGP